MSSKTPPALVCPHCGQVFKYPSSARRHAKIHKDRLAEVLENLKHEKESTMSNTESSLKTNKKESLSKVNKKANKGETEKHESVVKKLAGNADDEGATTSTSGMNSLQELFAGDTEMRLVMDISEEAPPVDETVTAGNLEECCNNGRCPEERVLAPSDKPRPTSGFHCDICQRTLKSARSLTSHKLIHRGVKPLECPDCGDFFRWKQTLRRHSMVMDMAAMSYQCSQCELKFSSQCLLRQHQRAQQHRNGTSEQL